MSADNTRHEPHMVCMFNDPGGDLFFLVKWYINNNLLTTTNYSAARYNDVNTTAALRPSHWTASYSMNMNVLIVLYILRLSKIYTCYSFSFKKVLWISVASVFHFPATCFIQCTILVAVQESLIRKIYALQVKCSVSAQYLVNSGPGPSSSSSNFFAGVTVNTLRQISMTSLVYLWNQFYASL